MEDIKKGYKQTDIGVIPEDWEARSLGSIITKTQLGGNYPNHGIQNDTPLIKMGNLNRGYINLEKVQYIKSTSKSSEQDKLYFGDLLFNTRNTLDLVGKVAIWRNELNNAYFNSNIMRIKFNEKYISTNFFMNLVLNTKQTVEQLRGIAIGTTSVAAIYNRDLFTLQIVLPTKGEQTAIATALSDTDALIAALDKKIAKKQQIKQGAMQQLLTGKNRLPGFSGEWVEKKLCQVALNIKTGKRNGEDNDLNGKYPFFVRSKNVLRLNSYSFDGEAILIPGEGGIGTIFHYINGKFDYHQRVYKISNFIDESDGRFIFYYLKYFFGSYALQNSVKATVDSLRLATFEEFLMTIPNTKSEQTAIAQILTDMDNEISQLEKERDKYKELKAGMMQVLLTGKIRLI